MSDSIRNKIEDVVKSFENSQLNLGSESARKILTDSIYNKLTETEVKDVCIFTGDNVINDCYVRIDYGYGANKDGTLYEFGPISEEIGDEILDLLQHKLKDGDISDHRKETFHASFES
jgi:hypothetical protein